MYHVIFRACDKVNAVNGFERPAGVHKTILVKACFASLIVALAEVAHRITVLGDKLSDELIEYFNRHDVTLIQGNYGNDESIRQALALAVKSNDDEWIYFCEDDYMHQPDAFKAINELIAHKNEYLDGGVSYYLNIKRHARLLRDLVIFPADYPDRYLAKYRRPSVIYSSGMCHWRQVYDITFTFMAHVDTVRRYSKIINHCATGAKDTRLSKLIFKGYIPGFSAFCVSPIPGLVAHMHQGTMSPLVDWTSMLLKHVESSAQRSY